MSGKADRRRDPTTPESKKTYTKKQFEEFYGKAGGQKMWKKAGRGEGGKKGGRKEAGGGSPGSPRADRKLGTVDSVSTKLLSGMGENVFRGEVADKFLAKHGLTSGQLGGSFRGTASPRGRFALDDASWTHDSAKSNKVAAAVVDWATSKGAKVFCHWFQPLGSEGVRHGQSGQVQAAYFKFNAMGRPVWDFDGKDLLRGETDGSSYPSGGLRATHTAGAYLGLDSTSPIFLRGDAIFIPACFVSFQGYALDHKTPLLRSCDALNREGTRLLKLLGYHVKGCQSNIGLEQELFFVPRKAWQKRLDLKCTGRTVMGRDAPRGQEMCDHYMGPLSGKALACMQEIQDACYKMGIPLRTRHREVAPNQFEFAPLFGFVTSQIDQNLIAMQVVDEIAAKHGLAALFQEKPFSGINGSGKHNNWSIGTYDGVNLFNVGQLSRESGNPDIFAIVMSAIVSAVDKHGDLMRMAIASPGNDFRLGACEAPPAILTTYLGTQLTEYLDAFRKGKDEPYMPSQSTVSFGVKNMAKMNVPAEDRNRTSPFPYGGHRFEFRAVGSSQNVSMVNTVLNTISAEAFKNFADAIEGGKPPKDVAKEALNAHWKCIFNGNGYDPANQEMLTKRGVWRIDSGVEAMQVIAKEKNVALFSSLGVMSKEECTAREEVMLNHYEGTVDMEAKCMIDMLNQSVIPSVARAIPLGCGVTKGDQDAMAGAVSTVQAALSKIHGAATPVQKAELSRTLRLETMVKLRETIDALEGRMPADLWTLPTYNDLLFLDMTS